MGRQTTWRTNSTSDEPIHSDDSGGHTEDHVLFRHWTELRVVYATRAVGEVGLEREDGAVEATQSELNGGHRPVVERVANSDQFAHQSAARAPARSRRRVS